jgi:putative ABC transport system permease protein
MIPKLNLKEVFYSISQHKLRNALTGFGIAWGIFILMLMMGFGDSFQKGIFKIFNGYADNTIWVYGGETSLNYKGETAGKQVLFDEELLEKFKNHFSEIEHISADANAPQGMQVSYDQNTAMGSLKGVNMSFFKIKKLALKSGRLFNKNDVNSQKPVCIISESTAEILFKRKKKSIGEYINVGGNYFQVVGISKPGSMFDQSDRNSIFIPYNYYKSLFNISSMGNFMMSLKKEVDGKAFDKQFKKYLANLYGYDVEDSKAVFTYNLSEEVENFQTLFSGVQIFIWFVGFCILLTGIISVGNIMYVNINERTREIGIRKAIGASPRDILQMILIESIALTTMAGFVGVFFGYIVVYLLNYIVQSMAKEGDLIRSVGVNFPIVITSLIILIISGVIAGILPAIKASKIRPVIALNQEN